jgi:hypothetical protein
MKITKANIGRLTLPKGKKDHIEFDDLLPGFGVRLREGGSRRFIFQYKVGAKQRRMNLGNCAAIDSTTARKQAAELHAKVRLGEDPAGTKAESRSRAEETFGQCVKII